MKTIVNTFWIAGNVIFDTTTGETRQVFMLTSQMTDATNFYTEIEAQNVHRFIVARSEVSGLHGNVLWTIEPPTAQRPKGYLIRGTQTVVIP